MKVSTGHAMLGIFCGVFVFLTVLGGEAEKQMGPKDIQKSELRKEAKEKEKKGKLKDAFLLYEEGCSQHDGLSCNAAGLVLRDNPEEEDLRIEEDRFQNPLDKIAGKPLPRSAAAFFQKACDLNEGTGCSNLGLAYKEGIIIKQNGTNAEAYFKKARTLSRQGCIDGKKEDCLEIAWMLQYGYGGNQDQQTAIAIYQKLCDEPYTEACVALGSMFQAGKDLPQDMEKAAKYFQKACDGDELVGCSALGLMYLEGKGIPEDLLTARRLFQKACDGGNKDACFALSALYRDLDFVLDGNLATIRHITYYNDRYFGIEINTRIMPTVENIENRNTLDYVQLSISKNIKDDNILYVHGGKIAEQTTCKTQRHDIDFEECVRFEWVAKISKNSKTKDVLEKKIVDLTNSYLVLEKKIEDIEKKSSSMKSRCGGKKKCSKNESFEVEEKLSKMDDEKRNMEDQTSKFEVEIRNAKNIHSALWKVEYETFYKKQSTDVRRVLFNIDKGE